MSEAEYRARLDYKLSELGLDYSTRSAIIDAKVKDCEDRAFYFFRSVEEEFEREIEKMEAKDSSEVLREIMRSHGK